MFEVDLAGLVELEGGKPPHRLAFEPVANVFDEYRGYDAERRKPSYCAVKLEHQSNPRGVLLTVADDGAGFSKESDIYTLFGTTAKRSAVGVAGRFNMGDKQLIAVARSATVQTNNLTVIFQDGKRNVTRHREAKFQGTIVSALMPWSLKDMGEVREQLASLLPPEGLTYTVDGVQSCPPAVKCAVKVSLPTVKLTDGVMSSTILKCAVRVIKTNHPTLFELGVPVCDLTDLGFPWNLDVMQKVPVPPSRDVVSQTYLYRLIGSVLEQAAMDGIQLLTEEEQGGGFIKGALDWVRDARALKVVATHLFGDNAVRVSSDPVANAQAAAAGAPLISGRIFSEDTRRRIESANVLPTSKTVYGGVESLPRSQGGMKGEKCPKCGYEF
jgi:hypothetical protein